MLSRQGHMQQQPLGAVYAMTQPDPRLENLDRLETVLVSLAAYSLGGACLVQLTG
jgi:hypothetical protein